MKKFCLIAYALVLFCGVAQAQTLNLKVRKIENITGNLYVGFYNSPDSFLKKICFGMVVEVIDNVMTIPCSGLSAGTYAISMFQDENGNNSLDKGALGIPQEKYGFSNITKLYGPPAFDQCKFEFLNDSTIIIDLQ